jgi:hypothetical protein
MRREGVWNEATTIQSDKCIDPYDKVRHEYFKQIQSHKFGAPKSNIRFTYTAMHGACQAPVLTARRRK